ncbi:TPA: hypothetical protein EYP66_09840 [Candidatus Poribacteria bacterium]|nr:hypothetical protein [Candidatus Poribacteria bacterium]
MRVDIKAGALYLGLSSVYFINPSLGWVVGTIMEGMTILAASLYTKDGGKNWKTTRISDWAIGDKGMGAGGVIFYTNDGGKDWQVQYHSTWKLTAVCFVSEKEGWTVGQNGTILHTQNGGEDWELQDAGVDNWFYDICYDGDYSLYVVGEWGIILRLSEPSIRSKRGLEIRDKLVTTWGRLSGKGKLIDIEPKDDFPRITHVYQNYPNPFNIETWIPFALKKPEHVVITIYDPLGRFIRKLSLGYKEAGYYLSRDKAAYWDGNNLKGEAVSIFTF